MTNIIDEARINALLESKTTNSEIDEILYNFDISLKSLSSVLSN